MMSNTPGLEWSSQVRVADPQLTQTLPGDKIILPPSALEQLLSASTKWAADSARRDLPVYDPFNSSTHFAYRRAEAQYEDQRQQLPHPLTFRLVNSENGRVVYAGIREFSAVEGEAVLSSFLREALGIKPETTIIGNSEPTSEHEAVAIDLEDNRPQITVHARQLPKGTFVKLRPLEAGYDVNDWKALLEQHLRNSYTTLTNGEVLVVPSSHGMGGKKQEFRFLVDGFKPEVDAICVVDTDLEVDIEALNEEQARETLRRIAARMAQAPGTEQGSTVGGELDLFKPQQGRVLPGEYVDYVLPSWKRASPIEFELEAQGESEILGLLISPLAAIQRSRPRVEAFVLADLESWPTKRIRLEPGAIQVENAEAMFVTVYAYGETPNPSVVDVATSGSGDAPISFTLRARHPDANSAPVAEKRDEAAERGSAGEVRCKNCGHWVPAARLSLHEATCYRMNVLCPKGCGQVFQKRSAEFGKHWHCVHDSSYGNAPESLNYHNFVCHPAEVLRCDECSTSETFSSLPALARHRTSTCPSKLILCRFCHLEVPQEGDPDIPNAEALLTGLTPHELADGARTTECHLCNKLVRLRDMTTHLKNHDHDRRSRPPPRPCRNALCGNTLDVCNLSGDTRAGTRQGQGAGNDIGLCAQCFGPLYVSMHDPENKALRRRIERRYLAQLLTGCDKAWCRNELCRQGRKALGVGNGAALATKDALPLVKPFLAGAIDTTSATPLHFCVDVGSQRRRNLAAMMAGEKGVAGNGGYSVEWCIGALEATSGDLNAAQTWLQNWAPSRAEVGH